MAEKMDNNKKIGERLRTLRQEIGKSAAEVANETGIGESALRNYECGVRIPRYLAMLKLAEYYGKTVDYIFFK